MADTSDRGFHTPSFSGSRTDGETLNDPVGYLKTEDGGSERPCGGVGGSRT